MSKTTVMPTMSKAEASQPDAEAATAPPIEARPQAGEGTSQKKFLIKFKGEEFEQTGRDALEAWALFCDGRKSWPSPKSAVVTEVK